MSIDLLKLFGIFHFHFLLLFALSPIGPTIISATFSLRLMDLFDRVRIVAPPSIVSSVLLIFLDISNLSTFHTHNPQKFKTRYVEPQNDHICFYIYGYGYGYGMCCDILRDSHAFCHVTVTVTCLKIKGNNYILLIRKKYAQNKRFDTRYKTKAKNQFQMEFL